MNTGAVFETGLRDKQKAIAAYEKLLERFPSSLYTNEARKRIRELRGDVL
jgi:outer membrane protein assembly factor BamD (BamD/ComL family)